MVYLGKRQLILHIIHTYNIFLSEVAKYMFCQCENTCFVNVKIHQRSHIIVQTKKIKIFKKMNI